MATALWTHQEIELVISHLGGMGDGVAHVEGMPVFVPFTAPGDRVRVRVESVTGDHIRASLQAVLQVGMGRQPAECPHFGVCGGCSLQHLTPQFYLAFKRDRLLQAVAQAGYTDAQVAPVVEVGAHSRRRVEFKVQVHKGTVALGYYAARSRDFVAVETCPVAEPAIMALFPPLKACFAAMKKPGCLQSVSLTVLDEGVSIVLQTARPLTAQDERVLQAFGEADHAVLSVAVSGNAGIRILFRRKALEIRLGGITMELPPQVFLQATRKGQEALTDTVLRYTEGYPRVADIYSGCGTYTFPLAAAEHSVAAYEGAEDMVLAMHNAALRHDMDDRITASRRDIFARPLKARELERFDAVVINPPRNGAGTQAIELAHSRIPRIVMISCNPATFARDAAILREGGYRLDIAIPVDQFYWNSHLELAAVFSKPLEG